ncbi:MAG: type II toxin-antitoxin system VapC family toxin [Planctomycetaceae bacterium]|nr:type II toxin-antitoxin system VapC family toxin [Planctomycetaceae bacterium]
MIVLDTHIFLWLTLQPEKLPENIIAALAKEDSWGLSAISLWETAMLNERGRITIPGNLLDWLHMAVDLPRLTVLPLTPEVAAQSESLPMHGDPADRIIAATSIKHECPLATVDKLLVQLPQLTTIS